jgi:hypothetical protein
MLPLETKIAGVLGSAPGELSAEDIASAVGVQDNDRVRMAVRTLVRKGFAQRIHNGYQDLRYRSTRHTAAAARAQGAKVERSITWCQVRREGRDLVDQVVAFVADQDGRSVPSSRVISHFVIAGVARHTVTRAICTAVETGDLMRIGHGPNACLLYGDSADPVSEAICQCCIGAKAAIDLCADRNAPTEVRGRLERALTLLHEALRMHGAAA